MIQNFQEEACFILDTMKGNKIVSSCLSLRSLRALFMVYSFEERGKVSTTISEVEKAMSLEIGKKLVHTKGTIAKSVSDDSALLFHLPWTNEIEACCFHNAYLL